MKKTIMNTPFRLNRNQRRIAAALMLASFLPTAVLALPVAPQVINGTATITTSGSAMTVTNSANAIINWQGFSIGQGESTRFIQPSAASAVLNRITGGDPSRILGALQSNGKVLLINPNGILFGQNARVDVNGLIASSLGISNQDFLAGKMNFIAGPVAGKVENQGTITTPGGGQVYLIAPDVVNSGIITAPNGDILLAAGKEVLLVDKSNPEIALVVSAPEHQAINLGTLASDAGRIGMYGGIVRQKGRISADSAVRDDSGRIFLKAMKEATVEAGSVTTASAPQGGSITVQAVEGTTLVSGTIEAKGSEGAGGTVHVLGQHAGLIDGALIDVSGQTGGGTVLVGGDYQGKNPLVPNAEAVYMGRDTAIKADALDDGNGGKVILWSDSATRAYGSLSAKGGANSGDAGFVETSGHYLDARSRVDLSAPYGKLGTWLLDPASITIIGGSGDGDLDTFTTSFGGTGGTTQAAGQITFANGNTGPSVVYQSEIEGQSSIAHITLEATDSISTSGTFTGSVVTLANNRNLTLRTRNQSTPDLATGINLTGSVNGSNLEFKTQGTGTITIETGVGGTGPYHLAPITIGRLTTGGGAITVNSSGDLNINNAITTGSQNIDLTSGGAISVGAGGSLSTKGSGNGANVTLRSDFGTGGITIDGPIDIGVPGSGGGLTVYSGGAVGGTGYVKGTFLNIMAANGNISLTDAANNQVGQFRADTSLGDITFNNSGPLNLTGVSNNSFASAGNITISSVGNMSLVAPVTTYNTSALVKLDTGAAGAISGLGIQGNNISLQTLTGGNIGALTGTFSVNPANTTSLNLGTSGTPTTTGVNITHGSGSLSLGDVYNGANLPLNISVANGNLTLNQSINSGSGNVTLASAGAITDNGGTALITAGNLSLSAANGISLTNSANSFVSVSATNTSSNGISLKTSGALTVSSVAQSATNGTTIESGGDMTLGAITSAGGVVTLRANNGKILDGNAGAANVTGAFRADFNDGSTTAPQGVGTFGDFIEVNTLGTAGITAQTSSGGIFIDNTGGALKISGIAHNGNANGDIFIKSAADMTVAASITTAAGNNGNVTLATDNGNVTVNAAINKAGTGILNLVTIGSPSGVTLNSNLFANTGAVHISAAGAVTQAGGTISGASLDAGSAGGMDLSKLNTVTSVNLTNSTSGNITYGSDIGAGTLNVSGNNSGTGGFFWINQSSGNINVASPGIGANGLVCLSTNGNITQDALGFITSTSLHASSGGSVTLLAANPVGVVAGDSTGNFSYRSANLLTVSNIADVTMGLAAHGISSGGNVALTSDSASGINQAAVAVISGNELSATSAGQIDLTGANTITSFSAANSGSGNIALINTAATLTINGNNINHTGTGNVSIINSGAINSVGWVNTANGDVSLSANNGTATIGNSLIAGGNGSVSVAASGAASDILLNTINVYSGSGGAGNGAIGMNAGRNIALNPAELRTTGNITLTAGGTITETGVGAIHGALLSTSSAGGTVLGNANAVNSFNVTNTTSGDIVLANTAAPLTITGINQAGGGVVTITNSGGIDLDAITAGAVMLTASGPITQSGPLTNVGSLAIYNFGSVTLTNPGNNVGTLSAQISGAGNSLSFVNAGNLNIDNMTINAIPYYGVTTADGDISIATVSGNLTVFDGGLIKDVGAGQTGAGNISLTAGGAGKTLVLNSGAVIEGDNASLTSGGSISGAGSIVAGSLSAGAVSGINLTSSGNAVTSFSATNAGSGDIIFYNSGDFNLGTVTNSAANGVVTITGANSVTQAGDLTTSGGAISVTANSNLTMGSATKTQSNGGQIDYTTTYGGIQLGLLDAGAGSVYVQAGENITDGNGALTNNIKAGYAFLLASNADNGPGSIDIDTQVPVLDVYNDMVYSTAGQPNNAITVRNSGSSLDVNVYSAPDTGQLTITNDNTINVGHIGGAADTTLTASGANSDITVAQGLNTLISAGNIVLNAGQDILVTHDHVDAGATVTATAGRDIRITQQLGMPAYIQAGSGIDLTMQNGKLYLDGTDLYPATIETASGNIALHFPGLASGGYVINGTEGGATTSGLTGIFVAGSPAVVGSSLITQYAATSSPTLVDCIANPALSGCSSVLPTLATCVSAPTTLGCSAVLPTLAVCTATPTVAGCSAVLPTIAQCTAIPTLAGCSAVLPTIAQCTTSPGLAGCTAVLPTLATCTADPAAPGCSAVLPSLAVCTATPTLAGCSSVLPTVAQCTATPTLPGCSAVLPTIAQCTTAPTLAGCAAVLPTLATCISAPTTLGCSAVLPTLAACSADPAAPGCSAVLPSLAVCTATPTLAGCSSVLPTVAQCTATPTLSGCSAILPTIAQCTTAPSLAGCAAVLPTLATCIFAPTTLGCSAVLPTLAACSADPTAPGCAVVLPTLAVCTATPTAAGCSAVLPTIAQCTATPTLPGCSAILPTIAQCTTTPTAAGCSVVLPTVAQCAATPTLAGCSAVLPTIAQCTVTPILAGCAAVLPSLAACTADSTVPGCIAVLPTLAVCTATPSAPGCSAVLPTIAQCTAAPALAGCSAVLPTIAQCTTAPTLPGCTAILPTIAQCTTTPTLAGCAAVLPTLAACSADPTASGCAAVLPPLALCTATPEAPGCSAVLPSLAACTASPTTAGCSSVLPTLASCTANPAAPGCAVVLPTLATCIATPSASGCSAVLPSLATCMATPTADGCSVVLPTLAACTTDPTILGCSKVLPPMSDGTGPVIITDILDIKTTPVAPVMPVFLAKAADDTPAPAPAATTSAPPRTDASSESSGAKSGDRGGKEQAGTDTKDTGSTDKDKNGKDKDKEDKDKPKDKDTQEEKASSGDKKDAKPKKNYCN